jgi:hypothetical protein
MPSTTLGHSVPHTLRGERSRHSDRFETRAIRAGQDPCAATGSTIPPIYQTATFTLEAVGTDRGFDYSRTGNPTRLALERQLAALENARFAAAFGSGMAAVAAACSTLRAGDHVVATDDLYGGTYRFFCDVLTRHGISTSFVDMTDLAAVDAALTERTKLDLGRDADQSAAARREPSAHGRAEAARPDPRGRQHVLVAVLPEPARASAPTSSCTRPPNTSTATATWSAARSSSDDADLFAEIAFHQNAVGAVPGPQDAYFTLRGAKTLAVRMRQHERNALAVAQWLETRDDIERVYYPGLALAPRPRTGLAAAARIRGRPLVPRARRRRAGARGGAIDAPLQPRGLARRRRVADLLAEPR